MARHLGYDPKDPDDIDDFTVNWSKVLAAGETISTATATHIAGNVSVQGSVVIDGTHTTARLTGGDVNTTAEVRFRITTSAGRQLDQTIWFKIEPR